MGTRLRELQRPHTVVITTVFTKTPLIMAITASQTSLRFSETQVSGIHTQPYTYAHMFTFRWAMSLQ